MQWSARQFQKTGRLPAGHRAAPVGAKPSPAPVPGKTCLRSATRLSGDPSEDPKMRGKRDPALGPCIAAEDPGPRLPPNPRGAGQSESRPRCPSRNQSRARARSDHGLESSGRHCRITPEAAAQRRRRVAASAAKRRRGNPDGVGGGCWGSYEVIRRQRRRSPRSRLCQARW
jgi:hypothetical protein